MACVRSVSHGRNGQSSSTSQRIAPDAASTCRSKKSTRGAGLGDGARCIICSSRLAAVSSWIGPSCRKSMSPRRSRSRSRRTVPSSSRTWGSPTRLKLGSRPRRRELYDRIHRDFRSLAGLRHGNGLLQRTHGGEQVAYPERLGQDRHTFGNVRSAARDHHAPAGGGRVLRPQGSDQIDAPPRAQVGVHEHSVIAGQIHTLGLCERGRHIDFVSVCAQRTSDQDPHLVKIIDDQNPLRHLSPPPLVGRALCQHLGLARSGSTTPQGEAPGL